jgi:hypothetical protein
MNKLRIPFDFFAAQNMPDWRDNFRWMLSEQDVGMIYKDLDKRLVSFAKGLSEERKKQNLFLLALPVIRSRMLELQLAALTVQAAERAEVDLISSLDEVNFLNTGDERYFTDRSGFELVEKGIKWIFLRRVLRTLTWTPAWKLLWVLIKPEIIAVAHNDTLRRQAWLSSKRVYFYQACELFNKLRTSAYYKQQPATNELDMFAEEIFALVANQDLYEGIYLERLKRLGLAFIKNHLLTSYQDLEALYRFEELPHEVWIASGGAYSSRAMALAALFRGGKATSFAHATGTVLTPDYNAFLMHELAVTSEFVDLTPAAMQKIDMHISNEDRAAFHNFKISSIDGSPHYKKCIAKVNRKVRNNTRPTVVYTPTETTLFIGPIYSSNTVYLDWQLRLVKMLQEMDIDLICQPHPQGIFRDRSLVHPLREAFNIPYRKFEDIIDQADVFLVDFIHSTIFGEMLASNLPIVRIALNDHYRNGVSADLQPMLDARCRTVPVFFGDDNLPYVDKQQLQAAILDNWRESVDSRLFQTLLLDQQQ